MIKITCPFCGFTKEVTRELTPKTTKSITCPICTKKFSFLPDFYIKAGFFVRVLAMTIDILLIKIVLLIFAFMIDSLLSVIVYSFKTDNNEAIDKIIGGVIYFFWIIIPFAYFTISTHKWGMTIGKKLLGIKVINVHGELPTWEESLKREVLGKLFSSIILGVGYIWIIFDKNKQALHDKYAKTFVVYS